MPALHAQQTEPEIRLDHAFAHPDRIRILALVATAEEPVTARDVADRVHGEHHDLSPFAYHLQVLAEADVLTILDHRAGRGDRHYRVNPARWQEVIDTVDAWSGELARISDQLANANVGHAETRQMVAVPAAAGAGT